MITDNIILMSKMTIFYMSDIMQRKIIVYIYIETYSLINYKYKGDYRNYYYYHYLLHFL